jgi:CheY-like chemotaxis protein
MSRKRKSVETNAERPRGDRRAAPRGGRRRPDQVVLGAALEKAAAELKTLAPDRAPLILVADDFSDGREMICEYLCFRGFRVEQASSGTETLEKARALAPDLILLDIGMPDLDGFEVMARLRAVPATSGISVAVFTAHAMDNIRQRVIQAGAVMFIPKPCELELLAVQIAHACRSTSVHSSRVSLGHSSAHE